MHKDTREISLWSLSVMYGDLFLWSLSVMYRFKHFTVFYDKGNDNFFVLKAYELNMFVPDFL